MKKQNLPIYKKDLFPLQREVTLTGGLLPHYILGYYLIEEKNFIINPNLFSTNKSFDEIMQNGFNIDQSQFLDKLNETNYSGFIVLDDNENYFDINHI